MKKHARFLLIALVVVAVLSVAIYALAVPASEAGEDIALQTVTFQEEEIPATESLTVLTDNPQFAQHGFQVHPVSDAAAPLSAEPMIDRDTAIETAVLAAQARADFFHGFKRGPVQRLVDAKHLSFYGIEHML